MDTKLICDFIRTNCGLFENGFVKKGVFGYNEIECNFERLSTPTVLKRYVEGGCLMQSIFSIKTKDFFDEAQRRSLCAENFYNALCACSEHLLDANKTLLLDEGINFVRFEPIKGNYIFSAMSDLAAYCIQCRVIYEKKADEKKISNDIIMKRNDKLMYYGIGKGSEKVYLKMSEFTRLVTDKNPLETKTLFSCFRWWRKVRYMPYIGYSFERHLENPVHNDIAKICDKEFTGAASVRSIVTVDFTHPLGKGESYAAHIRKFAVVGGREAEGVELYEYTGTMRAIGKVICGTAHSIDGWETCIFSHK